MTIHIYGIQMDYSYIYRPRLVCENQRYLNPKDYRIHINSRILEWLIESIRNLYN